MLKEHHMWMRYDKAQVATQQKFQREGKSSFNLKAKECNVKKIILFTNIEFNEHNQVEIKYFDQIIRSAFGMPTCDENMG